MAASRTTKFNKGTHEKNLRHICINFSNNKIDSEASCGLQTNPTNYLIRWAQLFALISLMTTEPKNRIVRAILIGYTIIVIVALCLYCILLIASIANEAPHEGLHSSSIITFQRHFALAFTLLGILLNVRLHLIETRDVSEITQCLSVDTRVVSIKRYYLR
uniref:Uncharacterized protein n=1 Tax=Parascaris univalens TaxID=6257 RepID=A0A915BNX6_PARUN